MAGISPLPPLPIELPAEKPVVFQQMTVFSLDAGILGQGTDFTVSTTGETPVLIAFASMPIPIQKLSSSPTGTNHRA
jgi:hypothetical protein